MPTFCISFVNRFGYKVITTHYSELDVELRLAEIRRLCPAYVAEVKAL